MKSRATTRGGFTLIELLVVIAIISLLSSIVLASLGSARSKAKDAAIIEEMFSIRSAAEIYFQDNGDTYLPVLFYDLSEGVAENICPVDLPGNSMFHANGSSVAKSIHNSIKHATSLTKPNANLCASSQFGYAITILLNEIAQPPNSQTIFCIDHKGTAKKIYLDGFSNYGMVVDEPFGKAVPHCPDS